MLSYNDCELIRELYKDFNIKELKVRYSLNNNVLKRKESKELLIMNFLKAKRIFLYSLLF